MKQLPRTIPPARGRMRPNGQRLLVGAALLALAGCKAVGPNYHLPKDSAFADPKAQGAFGSVPPGSELTTSEPLPPRWWHLYDDPVLDSLEEGALAANTDLRVASANLERAHALTEVARGAKDIEMGVDASYSYTQLSGESFLQFKHVPVSSLADMGGNATYQVDLFGRIRRSIEAARADEEEVASIRDTVKVTVAADVARAYVGVCAAHEAEDLAVRSIAIEQRLLDINRRMARAGRSAAPDVTAGEARLAQAQATLPAYRAAARASLYRLAALMGRVPTDYPREAEACRSVPQLRAPLPIGDGAAMLRRRPDVRAAERGLAGATARVGLATANLYPSVSLGVSGGSVGLVRNLGTALTNNWALGSLIHWSIPTAGMRARVRAEKAGAKGALAHFDGVVLGALRETETTLNTYAEDHNRHLALDAALEAARTAADQARRLREAGRANISADLGSRQGALGAEAAVVGSRHEIAMDQIELFLALGGGWGDEQQVTGEPATHEPPPVTGAQTPAAPKAEAPKAEKK